MATFRPFVFLRRGRIWTLVYPGPDGAKKQKAIKKLRGPEDERKAQAVLAGFIERFQASKIVEGDETTGPMTVARWAKEWLRSREAKGIATVSDYRTRLELHILPHIGSVRLDRVTPEQIVEVMRHARQNLRAPRSQRHVYDTMVAMFNKAIPRLLAVNPCCIDAEDLPAKKDADPEWRPTAIFTRAEVVTILTSPLVPEDRRVIYAVMFLTGMRIGEVAALKVRHNTGQKRLKDTKTERPRLVPVHPWLAQILDGWLARGWERMMGRPPELGDILIPTRKGTHRSRNNAYNQMNGVKAKKRSARQAGGAKKDRARVVGDLERLGLRPRRQHDTRRTFISLARGDGARKDLLRLVTHGGEGDVVDMYTEMPWASLCEEVAKLKLAAPAPAPLSALPNAAELLESGCHQGCHVGQTLVTTGEKPVTPPGIEPARNPRTINATGGHREKGAPLLGPPEPERLAEAPDAGQAGPMATMATLALRQALAALERGRVDQAREILQQAVAEEAAEARRGVQS
jgi:integrase